MANDKDFKVKNGLDVGSTVTLQAYGQGNNTGTAAKILAVDSSGNLIEEAPSAGGGLANVVEDTTPQLGGSLDVNGNSIVSVSGGDIAITPDADGQIVLDGLNWPISDGTDRQVLVTDGSGELTFDDIPPVQVAATNNTGSSIAAGTPVYQTGVSGQNITIAPADASSASTMPAIGVTKGAISASGGTGVVVVSGFLKGINTSTYTAGDTLYVANGGGFATSPPAGQTVLIENLGKVVKSDASAGSIIVTGAGRANATPNLNDGNFFLGNSSNQAGIANFTGSIDSHLNQANPTDGYVLSWTSGDYAWVAGGGSTQTEEHPTVTNGSATVTLANARTLNEIEVYLNGVKLRGGTTLGGTTEWTVSGTTLTFNQNLTTGDEVTVVSLVTATAALAEEFPTVTAGSADVTMSQAFTLSQIDVYLNGVRLKATDEYTVSGSTLTLGENLVSGDIVAVVPRIEATDATLASLSDTNVTGVSDGEVLTWDSTNNYWKGAASVAAVYDVSTSSTGQFALPSGTTAQRPATAFTGAQRFNTTTTEMEFYNGNGWVGLSQRGPALSSISGAILVGVQTTLTLTGSGFFGTANLTVNFTQVSDNIDEDVTVTPTSETSATVTVPAAVYNNVTAGNAVSIKVTNSAGLTSDVLTETAIAAPSGGTISVSGNYRYHKFTSSGTFTVPSGWSQNAEALIVAGGGGAAGHLGGGAGAGGLQEQTSISLSAQNYTIIVGAGGAGASNVSTNSGSGSDSSALGYTSNGGGRSTYQQNGSAGGSGGGGSALNSGSARTGGAGTNGQGNDGGSGSVADQASEAGGGGGANASGGNATSTAAGAGGAGKLFSAWATATSSGDNGYYAGGGGGGVDARGGGTAGSGGVGGGGDGADGYITQGTGTGGSGAANTGGGGGGGSGGDGGSDTVGGNGGSGIVIIRYDISAL